VTTEEKKETAVVQIRKGMRNGDEIVFEGVGNVKQNEIQGDVIFRVKEEPHDQFLMFLKKEIFFFFFLFSFLFIHVDLKEKVII
jgi:hypothetical protein